MNSNCAIFDFDSTLVSIETLDFLIAKTSQNQAEKVEEITKLAMNGKMTFADSLRARFANSHITKSEIEELKSEICNYITEGFISGIKQLKFTFDIYIISGGFLEIIYPVAEKLGIAKENCFANNFIYEGEKIIGFDQSNIMAQNGGKPKIVAQILEKKSYEKIFMIGDGYTDLEVAKANPDVTFCGFGEHAAREAVIKESPNFFYNVGDLIKFLCA
ncbi:MAG: HAD-IB family phosphatase [Pseudomonadota bacterium]